MPVDSGLATTAKRNNGNHQVPRREPRRRVRALWASPARRRGPRMPPLLPRRDSRWRLPPPPLPSQPSILGETKRGRGGIHDPVSRSKPLSQTGPIARPATSLAPRASRSCRSASSKRARHRSVSSCNWRRAFIYSASPENATHTVRSVHGPPLCAHRSSPPSRSGPHAVVPEQPRQRRREHVRVRPWRPPCAHADRSRPAPGRAGVIAPPTAVSTEHRPRPNPGESACTGHSADPPLRLP